MKRYFLILSIIGVILPYSAFIPFLLENGLNFPLFFNDMFATQVASFFSWDVALSGIVLVLFITTDKRRENIKYWWIPIVGLFTVGVSFALPFYLFLREDK